MVLNQLIPEKTWSAGGPRTSSSQPPHSAVSDEDGGGRLPVATCYHSSALQPPTATRFHTSTPQGKCWASLGDVRAQTHKHPALTRSAELLTSHAAPPSTVCLSPPLTAQFSLKRRRALSFFVAVYFSICVSFSSSCSRSHPPVNISLCSSASLIPSLLSSSTVYLPAFLHPPDLQLIPQTSFAVV